MIKNQYYKKYIIFNKNTIDKKLSTFFPQIKNKTVLANVHKFFIE